MTPTADDRASLERRPAALLASGAAAALGVGLLLFAYRHLDHVVSGDDQPLLAPLIEELSAAFSAVAWLLLGVRPLARRFPLDRPGWPRRAPVHLVVAPAFAAAMTSSMWGLREVLFPLAGLGSYEYGKMPLRYFMELPIQLLIYALFVAGVHAADRMRAAHRREVRAVQLEGQLTRAQLENLSLRLQPHFLFNALNTIAATMYDDPRAADEMVSHLAALLRVSLGTGERHEVPLAEELAALEHYLAIVRGRFGDDLMIRVEADPAALELLVPSLLVQPLVENAVRHGRASLDGRGRIEIVARREGDSLALEVSDDGPGVDGALEPGLGLSLTAERLRLLYGDGHRFTAGNPGEGGFRVAVVLPARRAAAGERSRPAAEVPA